MGIMESTPTGVETVNQIQLWLVICIVFVFLTVVIYALILCQMQFYKGKQPKRYGLDNFGMVFIPITFILYVIIYAFLKI